MTSALSLPFRLPQRKLYKCSLIEEGGQRRLHLCILGQLMGCIYLVSRRLLCKTQTLCNTKCFFGKFKKNKFVFVMILLMLLSHLTI